ncbi:MAG: tetratricopeptide repeat protein [Candidatus Wenzhouxiangella sp. M2_3B_020]
MTQRRSRFQVTLGELKRRHVVRTLGAYAVSVWAILQVADVVLPAVGAPPWLMSALIVATVVGAPVTAVLAWLYDLTPDGVHRTGTEPDETVHVPALGGRGVDYVIIGALVLILAFVLLKPETGRGPIGTSIAVLPFADLSAGQDNRYFSDGIAEAIMDRLARIPGIQLSARTSSFSFRGDEIDARDVASTLGVETLLEGSVRRAGSRLRISTRLIDGNNGRQVWSNTYEGSLDDAFELQDEISAAIAEVMQIQLTSPNDLAADLATRNPDAFDRYLRGRANLRDRTGQRVDEAIENFEAALALDPDFGLAAAGLCSARWERYESTRAPELARVAIARCERTLERHPELAETRIALGRLQLGTGEAEAAEASFTKALELEPNSAEAHAGMAQVLIRREELDDAARRAEQAIALDPAYWRYRHVLAIVRYLDGDLDAASESLRQAMRLEPEAPQPWNLKGAIHFARGEFLRAGDAFGESISRAPNPLAYSNAGTNYFFAGEFTRAEAMFRRAAELSPGDPRMNGFVAWSLRAQPDRTAEAEPFHRAVIRTATERLAINVNDHEARAMLAMHLAALGHDIAARAAIRTLADPAELDVHSITTAGFAHYLLGDIEAAANTFESALDAGLPYYLLFADPRLDDAWQHPQFAALAARHQQPNSFTQGDSR